MRKYEILVILQPKLSSEIQTKTINEIEKKIGGKIVEKQEIGLKQFAYPIKKTNEGHYVLYYVETDPTLIAELKNYFNLSRNVLRGLVLTFDKKFPFEMKTSKDLKFPERRPREDYKSTRPPRRFKTDSTDGQQSDYQKRNSQPASSEEQTVEVTNNAE